MISLDLSKGLHPRFLDLFPAFMPGLFFEISFILGNPQQVQELIGPAHLERYVQLIISLILAFIIGTACMCWVRLIQTALWFAVRSAIHVWVKVLNYLMNAERFRQPLPPGQPSRFRRYIQSAHTKARFPTPNVKGIQDAWAKTAIRLLKRRYGIAPPSSIQGQYEWGAWQAVLGLPKAKQYKGLMLANASHATGWSGLAAAHLAPALKNSSYLTLSLLLIVYGIITQLFELRRWNSREAVWTIRLFSLLEEIPQPSAGEEQKNQEQEGDVLGE
jgi:hypothetical protein